MSARTITRTALIAASTGMLMLMLVLNVPLGLRLLVAILSLPLGAICIAGLSASARVSRPEAQSAAPARSHQTTIAQSAPRSA